MKRLVEPESKEESSREPTNANSLGSAEAVFVSGLSYVGAHISLRDLPVSAFFATESINTAASGKDACSSASRAA